jgi:hypothetical protein
VDLSKAGAAFQKPLLRDARTVARAVPADTLVVLLGSIATVKYVEPLASVFGQRLVFPGEFVGRGDMSRGGLMLRHVRAEQELGYVPVANAVRHGKATSVDIRVSAGPKWLCLRLVDDGIGLAPSMEGEVAEPQHPRSLRERVSEAGGELRLRSLSSGTRVTIMLPIGKAA